MKSKKITAILLAGLMSVSVLTGCGLNKNATAATFKDGTEVSLGMVNFMCRYQQAYSDDMYTGYFGNDVWSQDISGSGTSMQESVKSSVVEQVHELYTLNKSKNMKKYGVEVTDAEKKEITKAAKKFMSENSKEAIDEMGATQEIVEEMLTLMTVSNKMHTEIEKEADTNVSDEEANMRAYTVVKIDTSGTTDESGSYKEYTDDEKADLKEKASELEKAVKTGSKLETAAKDFGYEATTATYDADDDQLDEDVKKALDALKEGETSDLITTDSALYIVRIDSDTDKDATEKNRESIIQTRKDDKYNEVLESMQKNDGWKVKDKLIAKIEFKNHFTQQDTESTEAAQETGTEAQTTDSTQETGTEEASEAVQGTEAQ